MVCGQTIDLFGEQTQNQSACPSAIKLRSCANIQKLWTGIGSSVSRDHLHHTFTNAKNEMCIDMTSEANNWKQWTSKNDMACALKSDTKRSWPSVHKWRVGYENMLEKNATQCKWIPKTNYSGSLHVDLLSVQYEHFLSLFRIQIPNCLPVWDTKNSGAEWHW